MLLSIPITTILDQSCSWTSVSICICPRTISQRCYNSKKKLLNGLKKKTGKKKKKTHCCKKSEDRTAKRKQVQALTKPDPARKSGRKRFCEAKGGRGMPLPILMRRLSLSLSLTLSLRIPLLSCGKNKSIKSIDELEKRHGIVLMERHNLFQSCGGIWGPGGLDIWERF